MDRLKNMLYGKKKFMAGFLMALSAAFLSAPAISAEENYIPSDLSGMKVAVIAGEGIHDGETLVPIGFLYNRGAEITVIGVEPGYVKAYNSDIRVRVERSVDDVRAEDYDAIVIPGGRSPEHLRGYENVVAFVREAVDQGKVTAAICHGPQLLIKAGVLDGKNVTAYPSVEVELKEAGANYTDVVMMRDGNIITSRVPDDLPAFLRAVEQALSGDGSGTV